MNTLYISGNTAYRPLLYNQPFTQFSSSPDILQIFWILSPIPFKVSPANMSPQTGPVITLVTAAMPSSEVAA